MEPLVRCIHCGAKLSEKEAIDQGWVKSGSDKQIIWQHNKVKMFNRDIGAYDFFPACLVKQMKKGTHVQHIPCGGGEPRITSSMKRKMIRQQKLEQEKK